MTRRVGETLEEYRARDNARSRDYYYRNRDRKNAARAARQDRLLVEGVQHPALREALLLRRALARAIRHAWGSGCRRDGSPARELPTLSLAESMTKPTRAGRGVRPCSYAGCRELARNPRRWCDEHRDEAGIPARILRTADCWVREGSSIHSQGLKRARRRLYEEVHGPIPEGHALFRQCREKRCVRPEHLQVRELPAPGLRESASRVPPQPARPPRVGEPVLLWRGRWEWTPLPDR